jgi:hypothetical protein
MQHYYTISFGTEQNKTRTIRINNPGAVLPENELQAAAAAILANDVFNPQKAQLTELRKMEQVETQRTALL